MEFERVAVIGPGLLGGSILLGLQSSATTTALWARRTEAVEEAQRLEIADLCSPDLETVVGEADLVILATPISVMPELSQRMQPMLKAGAIVTDVGSVKGGVVSAQETIFAETDQQFVGSHPMAGSEKLGLSQARSDLLDGAACFVTPTEQSDSQSVERVAAFWESLGMQMYRLAPKAHDAAVAAISHLPHAVAAILVESALGEESSYSDYIAGGFRDTTRIASGSPDMWTGIFIENREELIHSLRRFQSKTADLLAFLESVDEEAVREFLATAKGLRDGAQ